MIKNILWDFDGVILDSMKIRDWGFREIFKDFDKNAVEKLITYHNLNGGLSRYVKIRYFYEKILGKNITEEVIMKYANNFSILMKEELINPSNLILDSISFIKENHKKYNFHIVSGSDQEELRYLCRELDIDNYFISIHGSPTPKKDLIKELLEFHNYSKNDSCLIGDSINDYEAAIDNLIEFYGYNSINLIDLGKGYIVRFKSNLFFK